MLLRTAYKNEAYIKRAIEKNIQLVENMMASDVIKQTEKHQKKSLKQVRGIIDSIVTKRKLRTDVITEYSGGTLGKPPTLLDVREATSKNCMKNVLRIIGELYPDNRKTGANAK